MININVTIHNSQSLTLIVIVLTMKSNHHIELAMIHHVQLISHYRIQIIYGKKTILAIDIDWQKL